MRTSGPAMNHPRATRRGRAILCAMLCFVALGYPQIRVHATGEHAGHQHHSAVPAMDAEGRRLDSYDQRHDMTPEARAGLREKIALYRGFTDRELDMNMNAMGPDYAWYVSPAGLRGDTGILILAHGVGENSDRVMKKAFEPIGERYPTAIGYGMAMMSSAHLQAAVDDLVERGVKRIILVDEGTTTRHNTLTRQWQYVFGLYDEASYLAVPQVTAPGVEFVWTGHFDDHPLVTEMLHDNAKSVSREPANEVLIIVGHGPEDVEDNVQDLQIIGIHADRLRARKEFADVRIINLQDDAILPVREKNVRQLRRWIQQADRQGRDVIIVAIAAASFGVQQHIRQDLRGLDYVFAEEGLAENPKFARWVGALIEEAIAAD